MYDSLQAVYASEEQQIGYYYQRYIPPQQTSPSDQFEVKVVTEK